jgi:hypothetical protein
MHSIGLEEAPFPNRALVKDDWFPAGAAYMDGELILTQAHFLEVCKQNIEIMIHPRFTRRCPECGIEFDHRQPLPMH